MSFEFYPSGSLQALRCPVLDALAVFFSIRPVPTVRSGSPSRRYCGVPAHPPGRAGHGALALGLYMLAGHCALKPLFARPRPCDLRPEMLTLVARPHGWSFPSGLHILRLCRSLCALACRTAELGDPGSCAGRFIASRGCTLYVHFPTDILGGVALGLAIGGLRLPAADKISTDGRNAAK